MKVAILNNLFPPNSRGGAEEAAKNQADAYLAEGNEVIVLTLSPANKFSVQLGDNIKIYELPHKNIFNYFNIGEKPRWLRFVWHIIDTFNFLLADDIKKILEKEKPDPVICHNLKGLSLLTPLKIQNSKFKIHQVMHDVSLYTPSGLIIYGEENSFEHQGFLTRAYRFFTRKLFSYPEKVFFPSAWLLNFYRKNGFFVEQEKIYQPNTVASICQPADSKEESGFLYVGQLEPHKGIMLLLDAFKKLNDVQGPTLNIVGDGSLMPELKKQAENNQRIVIHGRVPREELPKYYTQAKATIFPSLAYENAPMVIAESLARGTPVIVSRLGGASELIREGENGAIFTPGSADDLVEKMKKYLR